VAPPGHKTEAGKRNSGRGSKKNSDTVVHSQVTGQPAGLRGAANGGGGLHWVATLVMGGDEERETESENQKLILPRSTETKLPGSLKNAFFPL